MSYITIGGRCVSNKLAGAVSLIAILGAISSGVMAVDKHYEKAVDAKKKYTEINLKIDKGNLETQQSINDLAKIVIGSMIENVKRRRESFAKKEELNRLQKDYTEHDRKSQRINRKLDNIK